MSKMNHKHTLMPHKNHFAQYNRDAAAEDDLVEPVAPVAQPLRHKAKRAGAHAVEVVRNDAEAPAD